jgi:bacteriocin-like protein
MHENHSKPLHEVSATEAELSDAELKHVIGGATTQTFHANTQRFDPYKTFRF